MVDKYLNDVLHEGINAIKRENEWLGILNDLESSNFKGELLITLFGNELMRTAYINNKGNTLAMDEQDNMKKRYKNPLNLSPLEYGKKKLYDFVKYDYLKTAFEGIYINENIIGLIKYLSSKLNDGPEIIKRTIQPQKSELNFSYHKKCCVLN